MFKSWYDIPDEKTALWLTFRVIHDPASSPTPDSPQNTTQTFTLFPLLPTELRLKIWRALIHPRIIAAACLSAHTQASKLAQLAQRPRHPAVPVLLHVNRESRAVGLRHYELAFAWKIPHRLAGPETGVLPGSGEARVWFNFETDGVLLVGELEPYDQFGFHSPMVYFLKREDTRRVRYVACAFGELGLHLYEADQVFGSVFHVVDMFPAAKRLVVTTTEEDVETRKVAMPTAENVVQKLWAAFINDTTCVTPALVRREILMVREESLAEFVGGDS